jgi:hypothetical protein
LPASGIRRSTTKIRHTLWWFAKRIRRGADCLSRRGKSSGRPVAEVHHGRHPDGP